LGDGVVEFAGLDGVGGAAPAPDETFECMGTPDTSVDTTRPSARRPAVLVERLRRLDAREFVDLCAGLWAARGYETRIRGERVVATAGDERVVVLTRAGSGRLTRAVDRLRRVRGRMSAGEIDDGPPVDVVMTVVDDDRRATRLAEHHGAQLVGPAAVGDLLLYGIPRADADALTRRCFGETTAGLLASEPTGGGDRPRFDPVSIAAVVGVVCLVAAAAAAGAWLPAAGPDDGPSTRAAAGTGFGSERVETGVDIGPPPGTSDGEGAAASGTPSTGSYPPGVTDGGVDAWVLADAHAAAVDGRSYRLVVRQSGTRALDGDRRWNGVWQRAVVDAGGTWLASAVGYAAGENGSELVQYTAYADGEFVYRSVDGRAGAVYDRRPIDVAREEGFGPDADRIRRYLIRYLVTTAVSVDRPAWRPETYRVVATGQPTRVDGDVTNYTATALIAPDGFVSELSVEYTRGTGPDAETVRFRYQYVAVGETTVRPPGWYDEARAATGGAADEPVPASAARAPSTAGISPSQRASTNATTSASSDRETP
jgi:hypothetical protein